MIHRWETHRGDEWWYSDHILRADAHSDINDFSFAIEVLSAQDFSADILHLFLCRTQNQFPDWRLYCHLDATVEPLIRQLNADGRLKWKLLEHPSSREAHIIEIVPNGPDS